ncbi:MAG: heavy metal translocating P-type ATPase [Opitutaceae bacterium]
MSAVTNSANDERAMTGPGVEPASGEWHRGWLKIAIALVLSGQGMAFGLAANISPPAGAAYWVLHGGLAASAVAVLVLLGGPLLRESLAALYAGRITVDLLFLITLSGALGVSLFSTLRRSGPVFYELVAILLAIYTTGKLLGARSRAKALQAVDELRAEHDHCLVLAPDGSTTKVRTTEVAAGASVLVPAGAAVGIDGIVTRGRSLVDTTPLTGEPQPVEFGPGDTVLAGMRAIDGVLTVHVTAAGGQRRLDAMLAEIEQARLQPSRLQNMADRLAARFVPLVVLLSAGTCWYWWRNGGLVPAVENSLAVLVVACPCALGLATPLGIWAGLVKLGRLGIVARSGDFLEALAEADRAMFDKTGTLFESGLKVGSVSLFAQCPLSEARLRAALAAAETGVDHPVAAALRHAFQPAGADARDGAFERVESRIAPGRGVRAVVKDVRNGGIMHEILAGSRAMLEEAKIDIQKLDTASVPAAGRSILVAVDGVSAAEVRLEETPRERAAEVFTGLEREGLAVEILTGDRHFSSEVWPSIARRTGMAPEEKAAHVRAAQRSGARVLFIGDGLNDAPALAAADASIAVRQGAGLARSNALAVVSGDSLGTLPAAVRHARSVRRAIRSNLIFAACYNAVAMGLAAAGWVGPILAAFLMAGSSVIVSTRVLRA